MTSLIIYSAFYQLVLVFFLADDVQFIFTLLGNSSSSPSEAINNIKLESPYLVDKALDSIKKRSENNNVGH